MLKIKDNVDLKELEKYGFKNESNYNRGELYTRLINDNELKGIAINFERKITFMFPYSKKTFPRIEKYINDLIQAGLVEKVEEWRYE